jgi:CBS domain containing-hemolysin-like protein
MSLLAGKHYYQNPTKKLHEVVWDPIIVKSSEKVSDVFNSLQVLGRNIAIVVNDKNEFVGVVSLEDLLEEIVGELK